MYIHVIEKFLLSLIKDASTRQERFRIGNYFEHVVTPIMFDDLGYSHTGVTDERNYTDHIDHLYQTPDSPVIHSCDDKAPRKGPKGSYIGGFSNDICIEYINKEGNPGSVQGKQEWSHYYVLDDDRFELYQFWQKDLKAWTDNFIKTSGRSPENPEPYNKIDPYYRWYQRPGKKDSYMWVPACDLLYTSGVAHVTSDVTQYVEQAYDVVMTNGGATYLDQFTPTS